MKRSREPEQEPSASPAAPSSKLNGALQSDLPATKIIELDQSALDDTTSFAMRCSLPPHREPLSFKSYEEYEIHYSKAHANRCVECRKNFPSEHLLSVHIEGFHDAFAAILREKGEHTYSCFVEGCDRKCSSHQKRRMHLIDKHKYPKNYFFAVTKEGIDGRNSLLQGEGGYRSRQSSLSQSAGLKAGSMRQSLRQQEEATHETKERNAPPKTISRETPERDEPAEESVDAKMDDLTGAMSALQFIPTSVRFGRGKGKVGFLRI